MNDVPEVILAAMGETNARFEREVIAERDIEALDDVYTAGARILPPGVGTIEGRERIKAFWARTFEAIDVRAARLTTVHAEVLGDGIVETGQADLTLQDGRAITSKYLVVWKQEDGRWKWAVDIWNLTEPAAS